MILEPLECSLTSSGMWQTILNPNPLHLYSQTSKPNFESFFNAGGISILGHKNLPNLGRIDLSAGWHAMAYPNRLLNGISKIIF